MTLALRGAYCLEEMLFEQVFVEGFTVQKQIYGLCNSVHGFNSC